MAKASGTKKRRGRPSAYRPEFPEQAMKLCRLGATDKELADFFGVAESTLSKWKLDFPDFSEALKAGKVAADANVADSLYRRAFGYSHPDVHISNYKGDVTITPITKHYPPETVACIFWLKNRRPDLWREKPPEEDPNDDPPESRTFSYNVIDGRLPDADTD